MTNRRTHTADFRRDAVQLARTNDNVSSTARNLSVHVWLFIDVFHNRQRLHLSLGDLTPAAFERQATAA